MGMTVLLKREFSLYVVVIVAQLCPMDCAYQTPPSVEFSRQETLLKEGQAQDDDESPCRV